MTVGAVRTISCIGTEGLPRCQQSVVDAHESIGVVSVIMMCTANRGRSPLAEAMLRRKLSERGFALVQVESAGMCVYELGRTGMGANELVADVARRHGFDLSQHSARPFDAGRFDEFDLIVVMEEWQARALHHVFHPRAGKVCTLRQLSGQSGDPDTPDVTGVPSDAIEAFFVEADRCLEAALESGPLARLLADASHVARPSPSGITV